MPAIEERLRRGEGAHRRGVVDLLGELGTDEAMRALKEHARRETDSRILAAVRRAQQAVAARRMLHVDADNRALPPGAKAVPTIDGDVIVVPPVPLLERVYPLGADQEAMLRAACHSYTAALLSCRESHPSKALYKSEISEERVDAIVKYVADGNVVLGPHGRPPTFGFGYHFYPRHNPPTEWPGYDGSLIDRFLAGEFSLVQAARLVACSQPGSDHRPGFLSQITLDGPEDQFLAPLARHVHAGGDIRAALGELAALGITPRGQLYRLLNTEGAPVPEPMPVSIFHLMLEHLDLFEEALGARPRSGEATLDTQQALDILALFPKTPAALSPALMALGLTGHKKLRKRPRALVAAAPGLDAALIAQLADADKKVRAEAATWIGERRAASAEAALRKALKAEKGEEGRAAMLTALSRIGADLSDEFSEKKLKAEAEKGLAGGAKSLAWFPFEAVPSLRWRTGKTVPAEVVKWWIVLAEKLKNPAGNALFDLYLDQLREDDAATLGVFLLRTFIARDTLNCGEEEASAYATKQAGLLQQSWTRWQQANPAKAALQPFNYARAFAHARAQMLSVHSHSCSENRGFLALSARAPGPVAAELVRGYLKDHGHKVNQSRALLTALARNPAPAAIQTVLAAANRLKQKSTQALAAELVQAIAEERGWTAGELADRTIPTGGFDEHGDLALDCGGGRVITAKYRGNGRIDLVNAEGKTVKALPAARGDEDKEALADAKKALASARKEVKQVESLQQARLYEAMCVERTWPREIWTTYLQAHPIVSRLCQRLVWLALDGEERVIATFRLLDDGSLSSNMDEPVSLDAAVAVKLAHEALLAPDDVQAWTAHLADYEITPLFAKFGQGRAAIVPPEDATEVRDREGWMIQNLKLAGVTGKRGYERGEVGDGGGFYDYVKRFEGASIRAVLRFTGSYVGATETFPCAIEALSFQRMRPGTTRSGAPMRMSEVPKILLAECIGDLVAFAAAGSGFDVDWRRKSDY
jgi:hypothetical protein